MNIDDVKSLRDGYELAVTYKCNWNCRYCVTSTHTQPEKDFNRVINEIENIDVDNFTLSGGEPGVLKRSQIEAIIYKIKEKNATIDLLTNGLFLKKYPDLIHNFGEIYYHCIEDMNIKDDIILYDNIDNIFYVLVITNDRDYENVEYYINRYPEIKFVLYKNNKKGEISSISKFLKFINEYKDKINYEKSKLSIAMDF